MVNNFPIHHGILTAAIIKNRPGIQRREKTRRCQTKVPQTMVATTILTQVEPEVTARAEGGTWTRGDYAMYVYENGAREKAPPHTASRWDGPLWRVAMRGL